MATNETSPARWSWQRHRQYTNVLSTRWSNGKPRSIRGRVSSRVHMEGIDCNLSARAWWPPFGMYEQTSEARRLDTMHLVLNFLFFFFSPRCFWIAGGGSLPTIPFRVGWTDRQDRQDNSTNFWDFCEECEWGGEWKISGEVSLTWPSVTSQPGHSR